jgi:hypothetical protein
VRSSRTFGPSDAASLPRSPRSLSTVKYSKEPARLTELRLKQRTAISAADIVLAEHYESEITALRQEASDNAFRALKAEFDREIRRLLTLYQQRLDALDSAKQSELLAFKQQVNLDFAKTRERHVQQLSQLQRDFAVLRLRETQRPVADADEFTWQAQRAARQRNFVRAYDLMEQAEAANQTEIGRRHAHLDLDFKTQSAQLFQEQRKEIEGLVARLAKGVATIEGEFAAKREADSDARSNTCVAELQKFGKRLPGIGGDVAVYQRELEESLIETAETARLPIAKRLRTGTKTSPRQTARQPRKS